MKNVRNIINQWDPIELFPMAPKDEYENEIRQVEECLQDNCNMQVEKLARCINKIFVRSFGNTVYEEDIEQCKEIAKKILKN